MTDLEYFIDITAIHLTPPKATRAVDSRRGQCRETVTQAGPNEEGATVFMPDLMRRGAS
jgi:hypothetical protein